MKHKSKINSDVPTCHPSLVAFQSKGQNCHLQGSEPEVRFVLWLILLLPTVRHLYKLTSLLPPQSTGHHHLPCAVAPFQLQQLSSHLCSGIFWHFLEVKSGCPRSSLRASMAAHCSWNSIYILAWPWGHAALAPASPVLLLTPLAPDPELCQLALSSGPTYVAHTLSSRPFPLLPSLTASPLLELPFLSRQVDEPSLMHPC